MRRLTNFDDNPMEGEAFEAAGARRVVVACHGHGEGATVRSREDLQAVVAGLGAGARWRFGDYPP